ncbi:MAG: 2-oxo-4-hydroxy-4-carboxy-5-ureidoimidazoline decarboxylase [Phycisphaerales bacterium]|jgi:2-oxo-4-hydroxy-4-carboxy-5-ureidoimidazoline decarboxylase|nr:2-oxo-4-hydroxy-4-carboxy-5-ureidoimidazoline decarboxylase [Phycisphaerales bacterium]
MTPLKRLNQMNAHAFVRTIGHVFENSPWIAEQTFHLHPFHGVAELHEKLCNTVRSASEDQKLALIRAHPDLVGRMAQQLTRESQSEQAAAGLTQLSSHERDAFNTWNEAYREQFGFPFVICARENKKDAILAAFPRRLQNSRAREIEIAIDEICKIAHLRLADAVSEE